MRYCPKSDAYYPPKKLEAQALTKKSIRSRVDVLKKNRGVTVNSVKIQGENFVLEGSFQKKKDFVEFELELTKGLKPGSKIDKKVTERSSAGRMSYDFLLRSLNLWM